MSRRSTGLKLARRSRPEASVPTASMSDIAFLLLLFFMVTTVFMAAKSLPITVPEAESTLRIKLRRFTISAWVDREGRVLIDDNFVDPDGTMAKEEKLQRFGNTVLERYARDRLRSVVLLRADKNASYGLISDLMKALQDVDARRLTFATLSERETE